MGKQIGQGAYATVAFGLHKETSKKVSWQKLNLSKPVPNLWKPTARSRGEWHVPCIDST